MTDQAYSWLFHSRLVGLVSVLFWGGLVTVIPSLYLKAMQGPAVVALCGAALWFLFVVIVMVMDQTPKLLIAGWRKRSTRP